MEKEEKRKETFSQFVASATEGEKEEEKTGPAATLQKMYSDYDDMKGKVQSTSSLSESFVVMFELIVVART